eukprot:6310600-Amphidinium_carterae.1
MFTCPRWERLRRASLTPHMQGIANLIRAVGREQLAALRVPRGLVSCPLRVESSLHIHVHGYPTKGFFFTDGSATDPSCARPAGQLSRSPPAANPPLSSVA